MDRTHHKLPLVIHGIQGYLVEHTVWLIAKTYYSVNFIKGKATFMFTGEFKGTGKGGLDGSIVQTIHPKELFDNPIVYF